uniref:4-hydroxybutyrate coenzyme A transferase n=1 Tax=Glossina morsitans morsitans TaxID=37546 RepID=D3TLS8_GLOMM
MQNMASSLNHILKFSAGLHRRLIRFGGVNNYFTYSNEITNPVDNDPPCLSPVEAVACIKSGDTVFTSGAAATPKVLTDAMVEHAEKNDLVDITVCHLHTEGELAYCKPELAHRFRSYSFFMGANVRKAVAEGRADNYACFLHEVPRLFRYKLVKPDVALVHVSPPDRHGFVSLGTSVDTVRVALLHSPKIIAQVNPQMPRTFGESAMHVSHLDAYTEIDMPLFKHGAKNPTEQEEQIGKLIADNLVSDGATLQMGIGSLPDCVLKHLHNHKDLGIHSEMFANGLVALAKSGAITNRLKPMHQGRIIGSFIIGDQPLYDYVHDNPFVELFGVDYVNNVKIIKTMPRMTAINSAIEIDLTGQVCADSIGTRFYSGFGGQVDFMRGAAEGTDNMGVPIIAMPSTTTKGESKIVPLLKPGAGVVTTRAHVHYVVTEYGIAYLYGKSLRARAWELIKIAHPDHREALDKAAFDRFKSRIC